MILDRMYRSWRAVQRRAASTALRFIYRGSLKAMGEGCRISPGVYFANPRNVSLGRDVFVDANCIFACELDEGYLKVGDGVQFNPSSRIDFSGGLEIGDGALISERVIIYSHDHGLDPRSDPAPAPLRIGKGAWVGVRSLVMPSVNVIGDNAVIGAGSVVTRDVPPNAVVAGNPAKVLRRK